MGSSILDGRWRPGRVVAAALLVLGTLALVPAAQAAGTASGAPGQTALWTAGNKTGFGTSATTTSKVWYTLGNGELTEVYYPDLATAPAHRSTPADR